MKGSITSPWGEFDIDKLPIRELIKYFMDQLKWMLKKGQSPDPTYTKRDLKGYKILCDEASDNTIHRFLAVKKNARESGKRFSDNIAVIDHMKANGLWERRIK